MDNTDLTENEDLDETIGSEESKAEKFQRLASKRVNAILQKITLLDGLSNRSAYEYTDEQVESMFTAIREQLDETEAKYKTKEKKKSSFSFN